jgi:hypothetical protein
MSGQQYRLDASEQAAAPLQGISEGDRMMKIQKDPSENETSRLARWLAGARYGFEKLGDFFTIEATLIGNQ